MLHPSYSELMKAVNENRDSEDPVVTSRYSIVIAAAKRARQIIENGDASGDYLRGRKALSIAVDELMSGKVTICPSDETEYDFSDLNRADDYYTYSADDDENEDKASDDQYDTVSEENMDSFEEDDDDFSDDDEDDI